MNRFHALADVVTDTRFDRSTNLARLQGWRGTDLTAAVNTKPLGHRLAPAICGVGALAVAVTGSTVLLLALLATAVVGVFAPNHPAESVYNFANTINTTGGGPVASRSRPTGQPSDSDAPPVRFSSEVRPSPWHSATPRSRRRCWYRSAHSQSSWPPPESACPRCCSR